MGGNENENENENEDVEVEGAEVEGAEVETKTPAVPPGTMVVCDDGVERPVVPREAAIEAGLNRYFSGVECRNGHMAERKCKGYVCVICARIRQKERHKKRLEEDPDYKAKVAKKRSDKHKERYANDPDYKAKVLAKAKTRRQKAAAKKAAMKQAAEVAKTDPAVDGNEE